MLLFGCSTIKPKPEPVQVPLELSFPAFPDPLGRVTDENNIVSMPFDYWLEIVRYSIDVTTARRIYEEWKRVQGN